MSEFYITIEKLPGDPRHNEYFLCSRETEEEAWDYAREKARTYGPSARVKEIRRKVRKIEVTTTRNKDGDLVKCPDCGENCETGWDLNRMEPQGKWSCPYCGWKEEG